jgi:hypothetical protein
MRLIRKDKNGFKPTANVLSIQNRTLGTPGSSQESGILVEMFLKSIICSEKGTPLPHPVYASFSPAAPADKKNEFFSNISPAAESNPSTVMAGEDPPDLVLRVIGCCHHTCGDTGSVEVDANKGAGRNREPPGLNFFPSCG